MLSPAEPPQQNVNRAKDRTSQDVVEGLPKSRRKTGPEVRVAHKQRESQVWSFRVLILVHLVFIAAVAGFWGASEQRDGLWKIRDWDYVKETRGLFIDLSLWWTAVPAFIFSVLGLYMKSCYSDVVELEPFLEVYRQPTEGRRSVLADYRRGLPPVAALKALRNGHFVSAAALLLNVFFPLIIVPLSSHLLETKLYRGRIEATALQSTDINLGRLNDQADFSRAFDITLALGVYNASGNIFSQWMNDEYAFPAFIGQNKTWRYNTTVEIANVAGHYGDLVNCTFLEDDDYDLAAIGDAENTTDATLRLQASLGGCDLEHDLDVEGSDFDMYFSTGAVDCSVVNEEFGSNVTSSRLLFLLAWPRPGQQEGLALATQLAVCSPVYGTDVGTLAISFLDRVSIQSFDPLDCEPSDGRSACNGYEAPDGARDEFGAMARAIEELTGNAGGGRAAADTKTKTGTFGNLVLNLFDVQRRDQSKPLEAVWPDFQSELRTDMIAAIRTIYKRFFLTAVSTIAFEPAGWPLDFKSTAVQVATDTERLFAVRWVCALLVVVLVGSLVLAVAGLFKSRQMRDWDVHAPANLVQSLELLCDNQALLDMARDVKSRSTVAEDDLRVPRLYGDVVEERWALSTARFEIATSGPVRSLEVEGLRVP